MAASPSLGFFHQGPHVQAPVEISTASPFQAVAIALLSAIRTHPSIGLDPTLLDEHPLLQNFRKLISQGASRSDAGLIAQMSSVLAQATITELCESPERYEAVLSDLENSGLTLESVRDTLTGPKTLLQVVAAILKMPLTLSITESGKELPKKTVLNSDAVKVALLHLVIAVRNEEYATKVRKAPEPLPALSKPIYPLSQQQRPLPSIKALLMQAKEHNQAQKDNYVTQHKSLSSMIEAGELGATDALVRQTLMSIYTAFYPTSPGFMVNSQNVTVIGLIVDAFAQWLSHGSIPEDEFYDGLLNKHTRQSKIG